MGPRKSRPLFRTVVWAMLSSALLLTGCGGGSGASSLATTPTPFPPTATPTPGGISHFEPAPCAFTLPFGQSANISCGKLTVPENHAQLNGRTIKIFVAILKATGAKPAPDPMVFLDGGPGANTTPLLIQAFIPAFTEPVQDKRDILLIDLRGTGLSEPS